MIQIPDHPIIRLLETKGVPDDEACCETCRWFYDEGDVRLCCAYNREPIASPGYERCDLWEDCDGDPYYGNESEDF